MSAFLLEVMDNGCIMFSGFLSPNHVERARELRTDTAAIDALSTDIPVNEKLELLAIMFEEAADAERG